MLPVPPPQHNTSHLNFPPECSICGRCAASASLHLLCRAASVLRGGVSALQLLSGALNELPLQLSLSSLPVSLTPNYMGPVTGYTLESQVQ